MKKLLLLLIVCVQCSILAQAQITSYTQTWDWDGWKNQNTWLGRTDYFTTWSTPKPELSWDDVANDGHGGTAGYLSLAATPQNDPWPGANFTRASETGGVNTLKVMQNAKELAAGTYIWSVAVRAAGECSYQLIASENGNTTNVLGQSSLIDIDASTDGEWLVQSVIFTTPGSIGIDLRVAKSVSTSGANLDLDSFTVIVYSESDDATLSSISVNGNDIANFDTDTKSYDVELPFGTTAIPTVAAVSTDANAMVNITQATTVDGSATIAITAENGIANDTYTVNFTVAASLSDDASLSDLQVDGTTVDSFDPTTLTYEVSLAPNTTQVPVVTATSTHVNATESISNATALPGSTTVLVTAEDGNTQSTYTINFTVRTASTNATLADLSIDGTTIDDFATDVISYDVVLPSATTDVPEVTATTTDDNASKAITAATSLPGSTTVVVTAEDGNTTKTYTVNFSLEAVTLSADKVLSTKIGIFPNPATHTLKLAGNSKAISEVQIIDVLGKTMTKQVVAGSINISDLHSGIYFIKIAQQETIRFIKQ